jgi:hypothetical protein
VLKTRIDERGREGTPLLILLKFQKILQEIWWLGFFVFCLKALYPTR